MKLSIVLLTWNSEKYIEKCLYSIRNGIDSNDYEIIVVDNGSADNTLKILNMEFPGIKLIRNISNRGVAPARNQGIEAASGEYILILDIDTYVYKGAIDRLLHFMEENQDVGLCGPRLCFDDGTMQNSFRRFPLLQTKVLRRINAGWAKRLLENEYYNMGTNGYNFTYTINGGAGEGFIEQDFNRMDKEAFDVDYVIGACQIIRRSALDEVGLLDDKIFYGPEDVDLCLRMWLSGWRVSYLPNALVKHYEQRITKNKLFSYISIKHLQGLAYYFVKHRYLFSRKSLYHRIAQRRKA